MKTTTTDLRILVEDAFEAKMRDGQFLASDQWDTERDTLGLDSLDFVELIMDVEKQLNIHIDDAVAPDLDTPNKLLAYLEKL